MQGLKQLSLLMLAFLLVPKLWGNEERRFDQHRESIAEEVRTVPGLLPWIYEAAGGREEVRRPGSLFGSVGLDRPLRGGFDPMQNVHGIGGLSSPGEIEDAPAALDLYGRNGTLRTKENPISIDTPYVLLRWGRGSFSGNALDLQFRRRLIDSLSLSLQVLSISSQKSDSWEYQNATHQPFLSALGRDSSTIPFTGRALEIDSWEIIPSVAYQSKGFRARFYTLFSDNNSSEPPALLPQKNAQDPYAALRWERSSFDLQRESSTMGGDLSVPFSKKLEGQLSLHSTERSTEWEKLPPYVWLNNPFDTLFAATADTAFFDETLLGGRFRIGPPQNERRATPFPALRLDWESRKSDRYPSLPGSHPLTQLDEDREMGLVEWAPHLGHFSMITQSGWQRISTPANSQHWSPLSSFHLSWEQPCFALQSMGWWRETHPTLEQRYLFSTGRLHFPNQELLAEKNRALQSDAEWRWRWIKLGAGVRWESSEEWIGPSGLEQLALSPDSMVSDTLAFSWKNYDHAESFRWQVGGELKIGNWSFGIRRFLTPLLKAEANQTRFSIPTLPNRHYAGHIVWQRKVLRQKNLDLSMRWDWHWIGKRLEWREDPDLHKAIRTEMDEWLALNFEARMRILDFELFFRARNMNHSQYFTDIGYTPAGINFQYGVTWLLKG